jgi:hypothetical protein
MARPKVQKAQRKAPPKARAVKPVPEFENEAA